MWWLYRQIVSIPIGTNCAPFVAHLFFFCCERDFINSFSDNNQTNITGAFNKSTHQKEQYRHDGQIYLLSAKILSSCYYQIIRKSVTTTHCMILEAHHGPCKAGLKPSNYTPVLS